VSFAEAVEPRLDGGSCPHMAVVLRSGPTRSAARPAPAACAWRRPHARRRGRAAGARPRARGGAAVAELRPWIERRLAEAETPRASASPPAATPCPTSARDLRLVARAGRTRAHRRGDDLLVPAGEPRRRSSAGTGARRARRSRPRLDEAVGALGARTPS
jgi:hypothetical protein